MDGSPQEMVGAWSAYLRQSVSRVAREDAGLRKLVETSGFIGTGIVDLTNPEEAEGMEGFPVVAGFQFGVQLFRAFATNEKSSDLVATIPLEGGRLQAPVREAIATFDGFAGPDGRIAAFYVDDRGVDCGITARHVVENYGISAFVPVECPECASGARLEAKAPGCIDAARVRFDCGGPFNHFSGVDPIVRPVSEGEEVAAHWGLSGRSRATVMQALSSPIEIMSAATPKNFLIDIHGCSGDSGSLIAAPDHGVGDEPDLVGLYLGRANCRDTAGNSVCYGYGLDLGQAAAILGANNLRGIHV